ncbi:MAG: hypothetical protein ACI9WH_000152, partial [Glaciecola sp.]
MNKNPISLSTPLSHLFSKLSNTTALATLAVIFGSMTALTACSVKTIEQVSTSKVEASGATNFDTVYNAISKDQLINHIKVLASDEFGGRAPATAGEKLTLDYVSAELTAAGFSPGNGDSFLQKVDLMEINADPEMTLSMGNQIFTYKQGMVASSKREVSEINVNNSDIVFLGYGVNAPEYDWNDYEKADVKGKTVIVLVNDPGFANTQ